MLQFIFALLALSDFSSAVGMTRP